MRARFLLFPALLLLTSLAPAQAGLLDDPCVNPGSVAENPKSVLEMAAQCTELIDIDQTEEGMVITISQPDGDLVITIVNDLTPGGEGILVKVEKNGMTLVAIGTCLLSILEPDGNPDVHVGPFYPNVDVINHRHPCTN